MELTSSWKCYGGLQQIYKHKSDILKCDMNVSVFVPAHTKDEKLPVLYYLSGLTCTEKNFIEKSGFQKYAAEHKIIVVGPDTSPRGCNIEGEDKDWDFGTGAGFYVDATETKWKENYRMYSYVTKELVELVEQKFSTNGKKSIFGHSMGGHGALMCALKNPGKYQSVSAFAPISNPTESPWGKKCFSGYLGGDKNAWKEYDASCLVASYSGPMLDILIDQGGDDKFLKDGELLPENFKKAASGSKNITVNLRIQEGYDHSYYFISTFIQDHLNHHAKYLL